MSISTEAEYFDKMLILGISLAGGARQRDQGLPPPLDTQQDESKGSNGEQDESKGSNGESAL